MLGKHMDRNGLISSEELLLIDVTYGAKWNGYSIPSALAEDQGPNAASCQLYEKYTTLVPSFMHQTSKVSQFNNGKSEQRLAECRRTS